MRGSVDRVDTHLIVSWPDDTPCADVEEAVKAAARDAIRRARTETRERQ